ncbi:hypothetical protein [Xanthomonas sacchari]|nr:hypothetical protein [Xanthomonas sacchari]
MRVFEAMIDPLFGKTLCRAVDPSSARLALELRGRSLGTGAVGHAYYLLGLMMETGQLWPRTIAPTETFSARSSLDVPLSPLDVADLVCKVPVSYRMMVHVILLTGIRPHQLAHMGKAEFVAMVERVDGRADRSLEVFEVHMGSSHLPIYLTLPIVNRLRSHVARLGNLDDRVFSTTASAVNQAWVRYADNAPALNRYKGTAGTHLLRHGGDAHVLSANLGINLAGAESMMERLSRFVAHQDSLAIV